jgi:predicted HTH transcriptional regulator
LEVKAAMSLVQQYILEGEHQTQDFKFSIEDQKKIARTIAAFANTDGGRLLIGVKDNGKIAGCNPEEEFHMMVGAAELYVQPPVILESKVHQEGHKLVLEVNVPKGEQRNYKAQDEEGKFRLYFRHNDHTLRANKIVARVWRHHEIKVVKPAKLEDEALQLIRFLSQEPLTLSKMYRSSGLSMKKIDYWLPLFIAWDLVTYEINDHSFYYKAV